MTTNHPAHGPVSLDRLHQISEILSKAAAQSDGGNLGYAMADAVKVIDGVIAAFGAEPVGEVIEQQSGVMMDGLVISEKPTYRNIKGIHKMKMMPLGTKFYTAPPAPVVPTFDEWLQIRGNKPLGWVKDAMRESYDACRAARLQAGNPPVNPDGWIPVSERMPNDKDFVWCYGYVSGWTESDGFEAYYDATRNKWWTVDDETVRKVTHWTPLPAAPQQEVKSALEHGMRRYAGAMQKLSEGDD